MEKKMNKLSMLSVLLSFLIGCNYAAASGDRDSESSASDVGSDNPGTDLGEDTTKNESDSDSSESDSEEKKTKKKVGKRRCAGKAHNKESVKCTDRLNLGLPGDGSSDSVLPIEPSNS
jgi:hypothetical protein